jgi:hypothetical protein
MHCAIVEKRAPRDPPDPRTTTLTRTANVTTDVTMYPATLRMALFSGLTATGRGSPAAYTGNETGADATNGRTIPPVARPDRSPPVARPPAADRQPLGEDPG